MNTELPSPVTPTIDSSKKRILAGSKMCIDSAFLNMKTGRDVDWCLERIIHGECEWPTIPEADTVSPDIISTANDKGIKYRCTSFVRVSTDEIQRGSRTPEMMQFDTTCLTNKYNFGESLVIGADSNHKTNVMAHCLVDGESEVNFNFIWSVALPLIYGKTLDGVSSVTTDGDPYMRRCIKRAIDAGFVGQSLAVLRLCFFHGCSQLLMSMYPFLQTDGGVAHTLQRSVKIVFYESEIEEEFDEQWGLIVEYLNSVPVIAGSLFTQ